MKKSPFQLKILIFLLSIHGIVAFLCGILLIIIPDVHILHIPQSWLPKTPFSNYLFLGIILLIFVGIYPIVIGYSLIIKPDLNWLNAINPIKIIHWAWVGSITVGLEVIIWMTVQIILLRSIHILYIINIVWGIIILLLTLHPKVKEVFMKESIS
jgi:hypothetical protein